MELLSGLAGVDDAGRLFLGDTADGTPGVAVTLAMEGSRPLACEVQALAAPSTFQAPRRVASGLDPARLSLLAAVLQQRAQIPAHTQDLYVSTVGGLRLTEPAVDLALADALRAVEPLASHYNFVRHGA
jgi:DNA repair protein RadA/Sms